MQKRAGLLFLSKSSGRILLVLEDFKWTVPTFARKNALLEDAETLLEDYSRGKMLPIELYLSEDRGFEYGTYICLVDKEFCCDVPDSYSWCKIDHLPKQLHTGLKNTLNNSIIQIKIKTILELQNAIN